MVETFRRDMALKTPPPLVAEMWHALTLQLDELFRTAEHDDNELHPDSANPPRTVLLALSGGADSIALLHLLREGIERGMARSSGITRIWAAHINHRLRSASEAEQQFCEEHCRALDVPCEVHVLCPPGAGINVEQWAREERYRALRSVRAKIGACAILTAHHEDDQRETMLLRLLANKDMRLILPVDPVRRLLRPLLGVSRAALQEYIQMHSLPFVHDESNDDSAFTRNRIRNELIPFLIQKFGPAIPRVLSERAASGAEDIEGLTQISAQLLQQIETNAALERTGERAPTCWRSSLWVQAARRSLSGLPKALQWRVVEEALAQPLGYRLGRSKSLEALRVVLGLQVAMQCPGGVELRRSENALYLNKLADITNV